MAFSIILIIIGAILLIVGALIKFKNMYFFIIGNNELNNENIDKKYASKVGITQFICGLWLITIGSITLFLNIFVTMILFIVSVLAIIIAILAVMLRKNK